MKKRKNNMHYEIPQDSEILERYLQKHSKGNKASMRQIKRELRKLRIVT